MTKKAELIIEAKAAGVVDLLVELYRFRSFYLFLFNEISMKKWKNTFLGFWWMVVRPLVPTTMAVITFTFIVPMESYGLPYAVFYLSGFVIWHTFHASVAFMPRTMLWMRNIMKKTYFPKVLVPLASLGPPLMEFIVVFIVLGIAVVGYYFIDGVVYINVSWNLALFPLCLFATLTMSIGIGMITSVMALFMRDIVFSVGYFVQVLMFLTPVIYPISFVPENYRWIIYLLNPMAKQVETSRWALTGHGVFDPLWFGISCGFAGLVFLGGCWFFFKVEPLLTDSI